MIEFSEMKDSYFYAGRTRKIDFGNLIYRQLFVLFCCSIISCYSRATISVTYVWYWNGKRFFVAVYFSKLPSSRFVGSIFFQFSQLDDKAN